MKGGLVIGALLVAACSDVGAQDANGGSGGQTSAGGSFGSGGWTSAAGSFGNGGWTSAGGSFGGAGGSFGNGGWTSGGGSFGSGGQWIGAGGAWDEWGKECIPDDDEVTSGGAATSCSGVPSRMPVKRVLVSGASSPDGLIYLFGGQATRTRTSACHAPLMAYDPATGRYRTLASAPVSLYDTPAVVFTNGTLMALDRELVLYDPATDSWRKGVAPPRILVARAATVAPDGRVFFLGGVPWGDAAPDRADAYDPVTETWSSLPPLPFGSQWSRAVTAGGRVYVVGIQTAVFDPATQQWTELPKPPTERYDLGAGVDPQGRIITFGGSPIGGPGPTNVVEIFDPVAASWSTGPRMAAATSMFATGTACGGRLFAFGGENGEPGPLDALDLAQVYAPENGSWMVSR